MAIRLDPMVNAYLNAHKNNNIQSDWEDVSVLKDFS